MKKRRNGHEGGLNLCPVNYDGYIRAKKSRRRSNWRKRVRRKKRKRRRRKKKR